MPFNLGGPELLIILVIVLVVFGAGRLPHVMKDVGTGLREFKRAQTEAPPAEAPRPAPVAEASTGRGARGGPLA